MIQPKEEIIRYRLNKAKESLEEAHAMANMNHWQTCINRLYYACFYAVIALLLKHDLSSPKHTGVRSLFNSKFISTGIISREYGKLYNLLFKYRQQSDYEDFFSIDEDIVKQWIGQVTDFVKNISKNVNIEVTQ